MCVVTQLSGETEPWLPETKGQGKLGLHTIPCLPQEFVSISVSVCALILRGREMEVLSSVSWGRSGGALFGVIPF